MKSSVAYRMAQARNRLMQKVNEIGIEFDLPAFILEEILADVLGECRQQSKVELLRDLEEKENGQSVQQDNVD